MTIQKQSAPAAAHSTDAALTGSHTAQNAAAKARAALETIVSPAITPKLSQLPTTKERLHAVADAIERAELAKRDIGFNMVQWNSSITATKNYYRDANLPSVAASIIDRTGHKCGTIACIAGWTDILNDQEGTNGNGSVAGRARNVLGLSSEEGEALFHARGAESHLADITSERAVAVIRHFANTGNIRWAAFDSDGKPK